MKVAVIVVNYNDETDTLKYVNAISSYNCINKIVVVDNKSTTKGAFETLSGLKNEKVDVIQAEKNGGYNYGNNYGIRHLEEDGEEYDYYIVSNPDIEVSEEAIKKSLDVLENDSKLAVAAPRMYNKNDKPIRRCSWKVRTFWRDVIHSTRLLELVFYKGLRNGEYSEEDYKKDVLEVEAISGAFFIIKAKILKEIDYFDENVFLFYEEDILSKRLMGKGYKTASVNSEKFIHYESQTIGKTFSYFTKMIQLFKSKIYYHRIYGKINILQVAIYYALFFFRMIELIIEVPVRKILRK